MENSTLVALVAAALAFYFYERNKAHPPALGAPAGNTISAAPTGPQRPGAVSGVTTWINPTQQAGKQTPGGTITTIQGGIAIANSALGSIGQIASFVGSQGNDSGSTADNIGAVSSDSNPMDDAFSEMNGYDGGDYSSDF